MSERPPCNGQIPLTERGDNDHASDFRSSIGLEVSPEPSKRNVWLRKTTLIGFAIVFVACAGALVGLSHHIASQDGLPLSVSSNHYSWTYGPTAILVVALSLWRQVDHHCKSMQPWWQLSKGPSSASESLLLDYISPFQPTSCIEAFRNGHYPVALSITTFFLIKSIILISTTLFFTRLTPRSEYAIIRHPDTFDSENVWTNLAYNREDIISGLSGNESRYKPIRLPSQADMPVWSLMAKVNGNVSVPSGTDHLDWAHQSITDPVFRSDVSSVSASVDALIPVINCEEAIILPPKFNETIQQVQYFLMTENCTSRILTYAHPSCANPKLFKDQSCTESFSYESIQPISCSTKLGESLFESNSAVLPDADIRFAITTGNFMSVREENKSTAIHAVQAAAVICKVQYGITSIPASKTFPDGHLDLDNSSVTLDSLRLLPRLADQDIVFLMLASLLATRRAFLVQEDTESDRPNKSNIDEASSMFFLLFDKYSSYDTRLESPKDSDQRRESSVLQRMSTEILTGLLNEFAKKSLVTENNHQVPFNATALVIENKLHIQHQTLWLMVAGFGILSFLCLILLFVLSKQENCHEITGSIASLASVLNNSPSLMPFLKDTGPYTSSQMQVRLEDLQFRAVTSRHGLSIQVSGEAAWAPASIHQLENPLKQSSWVPLSGKLPMIILLVSMPLLCIVTLEVLQHLSSLDAYTNVLRLKDTDFVASYYLARLTSVLLVFVTATLFNNLDAAVAIFAPFTSLRSGSSPADRSILFHLLGLPSPLVPFQTMRLRHLGPAASYVASLLGGFLTIAVSGLWTIRDHPQVERTSTTTARLWAIDWSSDWSSRGSSDGGAGFALNIIRHGGAETPNYIQNRRVLPIITLNTTQNYEEGYNVTFETTVLQPQLECAILSQNETFNANVTRFANPRYPWVGITLSVLPNAQPECFSGIEQQIGGAFLDISPSITVNTTDYWAGRGWDLRTSEKVAGQPCPSLGILFGRVHQQSLDMETLSVLLCSQSIDEIPATITYRGDPEVGQLADFQLHQEQKKTWRNETDNSTRLNFQLGKHLSSGFGPFQVPPDYPTKNYSYDPFFEHLTLGPGGVSPWAIYGPGNVKDLRDAVVRNYGEYMVHFIDHNLRSNANASVQGKVSQPGRQLYIHRTSKIVLEVLLATMTVLGMIAYRLVKFRGTLPRSPCGIASTMGFLAGSQLCDPNVGIIPLNATLLRETEIRECFRGYVFSLGWWDSAGERVQSTGISINDTEQANVEAENPAEDDELAEERQPEECSPDDDVAGGFPPAESLPEDVLAEDAAQSVQQDKKRSRFGIDVGKPEVLGFEKNTHDESEAHVWERYWCL